MDNTGAETAVVAPSNFSAWRKSLEAKRSKPEGHIGLLLKPPDGSEHLVDTAAELRRLRLRVPAGDMLCALLEQVEMPDGVAGPSNCEVWRPWASTHPPVRNDASPA